SARRPPPRVRGQRRRTARAHSHVPPDPPEIARPRREHHERRLARRISRMGRLREQQGRARSPEQDARERVARSRRRRRRGRPGRSPDADAPGRVPGTGHQRPAPPGRDAAVLGMARRPESVARHGPAVRGPRHGLGGARMRRQELVFEQPRELFAATPVETEHGARDAVRLLVTTPSGHQHATFRYVAAYPGIPRLWFITADRPLEPILQRAGVPIHYGYVQKIWPLDAYQSLFSRVPGSAEMPSAARPITPKIQEALEAAGIRFTSVLLHSGVSSLEIETDQVEEQAVYPEPFEVSAA